MKLFGTVQVILATHLSRLCVCVCVCAVVTSWVDLGQVREDTVVGSLALNHVSSLNGYSSHHSLFRGVFLFGNTHVHSSQKKVFIPFIRLKSPTGISVIHSFKNDSMQRMLELTLRNQSSDLCYLTIKQQKLMDNSSIQACGEHSKDPFEPIIHRTPFTKGLMLSFHNGEVNHWNRPELSSSREAHRAAGRPAISGDST